MVAPAVPNRSLLGDSGYIASVVRRIPGQVVLVGHSYGGAVIIVAGGDGQIPVRLRSRRRPAPAGRPRRLPASPVQCRPSPSRRRTRSGRRSRVARLIEEAVCAIAVG
ncbi:alpha/beta fold hydrolase [Streptomyces diastatochromogenes]|uniref:alpha/beta fold hydrolase n=1 Tax=Streptomyces diastatochromogenes TaxID=42236 RepID=UPI003687494D